MRAEISRAAGPAIARIARVDGLPALAAPLERIALRRRDAYGAGGFGASRDGGRRRHLGIDLVANPGEPIVSPASGALVVFDPYRSLAAKRGRLSAIQLVTDDGFVVRLLYVEAVAPLRASGARVAVGQAIGVADNLSKIYPPTAAGPMTNHVHLDIQRGRVWRRGDAAAYLDPTPLVAAWALVASGDAGA
ncbi:MAG TPA: M23 family peptidase [Alphaproteobacteria bacterium]|nr:M23 family peptidase [Alphaproteobacteria bacterium]